MPLQKPALKPLLLVVLGVTVLWIGLSAGTPDGTVREYTAFEVDHDDELVLTNAETGELRSTPMTVNVDERIVCLPRTDRECYLAMKEHRGEITTPGVGSQYRYAYVEDEFYQIRGFGTGTNETDFDRTDADDAFDDLAVESERVTDRERDAIEEGRIVTTQTVPHTNRLVEHEGQHYTILHTGTRVDRDHGTAYTGGADDFARESDTHHVRQWLRFLGLTLPGALAVAIGGRDLFRGLRSTDET